MKYFKKLMVFFLFMLFGYGVDTCAYTYKVTNKTGKLLKVQLHSLLGELHKEPIVIMSNATQELAFKGSLSFLCLSDIMISRIKQYAQLKDSIYEPTKWTKPERVKMDPVSMRISLAIAAVFVGEVGEAKEYTLCGDHDVILVIDEKSGKIKAIFPRKD